MMSRFRSTARSLMVAIASLLLIVGGAFAHEAASAKVPTIAPSAPIPAADGSWDRNVLQFAEDGDDDDQGADEESADDDDQGEDADSDEVDSDEDVDGDSDDDVATHRQKRGDRAKAVESKPRSSHSGDREAEDDDDSDDDDDSSDDDDDDSDDDDHDEGDDDDGDDDEGDDD